MLYEKPSIFDKLSNHTKTQNFSASNDSIFNHFDDLYFLKLNIFYCYSITVDYFNNDCVYV